MPKLDAYEKAIVKQDVNELCAMLIDTIHAKAPKGTNSGVAIAAMAMAVSAMAELYSDGAMLSANEIKKKACQIILDE